MTQDFANKGGKPKRRSSSKSSGGSSGRDGGNKRGRDKGGSNKNSGSATPWPWFVSGMVCGILLSGLAWLALQQPETIEAIEAATAPVTQERPKPRFDFYTLLPEQRIDVELEPDTVATERPEPVISQFLLQAGSFKQEDDADRRRAELILLGLEASIKAATTDNGQWYRVYIGPFESRSKLQSARSLTAQQGIDTLLLKRPAG